MIVSVFFSQFLLLGIIVIDYNGLHSVCLARFSSAFFVRLFVGRRLLSGVPIQFPPSHQRPKSRR